VIATGENLAIGAARAAPAASSQNIDTIDLEFDPFVQPELLGAKRAMRRFGFCLYVEGHSFPMAGTDAYSMMAAARKWCDAKDPPIYHDPAERFAALPLPPDVMQTGVLYRPTIGHKIVILQKEDPGGAEPWALFQSKRFDLPNVSPVLSIGVERATFTTRQTTLNFDHGVLTDVAVNKKSELAGFVTIPLAVAQAIADIPGQIITLRITDVNNKAALLNAQTQLIQAVSGYQQTVAANPLPANAADVRSARIYGACKNAGGNLDDCKGFAKGLPE
jgi:hypothetical protein